MAWFRKDPIRPLGTQNPEGGSGPDGGGGDASFEEPPNADPPRKPGPSVPRLIIGGFVVLVGLSILSENTGLLSKILPLFLIILGLVKIFATREASGRMFGALLLFVGLILISGMYNLWPLLIIFFGLHILWRGLGRNNVPHRGRTSSSADSVKDFVLFGSSERTMDSQAFRGGEITAVFGGVELDLRRADLETTHDAVMDIFTLFGGIEIRIPEDWEVSQEANAIFGGVEDKSHYMAPPGPGRKRLILRGYALFGGIEIKN